MFCAFPPLQLFFNFLHQEPLEKSLRHASCIAAEMLSWGIPHLLLFPGQVALER